MVDPEQQRAYSLTHPVYLDVPMMISFLAHLEGGVATGEEETKRETGARERALRGRTGFRFRLPAMADAEARAEGASQRRDETMVESTSQRHHTAASLFNLLYEYLIEDDQLTAMTEPDDVGDIAAGQLVELTGTYLGNPLEDVLAFLNTLIPYLIEQQEAQQEAMASTQSKIKAQKKSGNPARRAATEASGDEIAALLGEVMEKSKDAEQAMGMKMVLRMAEDMQNVPVHDLLVRTDAGLNAVLTVSSDFFTAATNEYLRSGQFRVVGKVTRSLAAGDTINLTRRTVLGAARPETAQDIIDSFQSDEIDLDVAEALVQGPCVQILPMAIFI